jgi:hypothetical protein
MEPKSRITDERQIEMIWIRSWPFGYITLEFGVEADRTTITPGQDRRYLGTLSKRTSPEYTSGIVCLK